MIKKIAVLILVFSSNIFADFTLGIYCVNNSEDISIVRDAGFNTIQTYKKDPKSILALANESQKQGITLLAYPDKIIGSHLQKEVQKYPIIWYLCDEPDLWNISRQKLKSTDDRTRRYLPGKKTAFVLGQGKTKISYYDIGDILMVDWYPVPHLPLQTLGYQINYARQQLNSIKGNMADLWAVIQLFDWTEEKNVKESARQKYKLRFPTKEEIRFMSYDAIFNGATGLFYFQYNSKGKPLYQSRPKEWIYITEIIQELQFTTKLFEKGHPICNPNCDKKTSFCDICRKNEFVLTGNESFIQMKSFEYDEAKYTIMINPTSKYQTIPKIFYDKKFDVIFEEDTILKNIVKDKKNNLKPYGILIFRYD